MGQKIHPLGLRLGVTQSHLSNWCAQPKRYSRFCSGR
jgi:small subunit ribosomal protein S3